MIAMLAILVAVALPFIVIPPVYDWIVNWIRSAPQRRARRFLRKQWKYL